MQMFKFSQRLRCRQGRNGECFYFYSKPNIQRISTRPANEFFSLFFNQMIGKDLNTWSSVSNFTQNSKCLLTWHHRTISVCSSVSAWSSVTIGRHSEVPTSIDSPNIGTQSLSHERTSGKTATMFGTFSLYFSRGRRLKKKPSINLWSHPTMPSFHSLEGFLCRRHDI